MTITEFLLARIAEDENEAKAASPGGWQFPGVATVAGGTVYDQTRRIVDVVYEQPDDHDGSIARHILSGEADANGHHIARHDPARVLAECEAKRRIVELHRDWPVLVESPPKLDHGSGDSITVRMTQQIAWTTEQKYREHFGTEPPTGPIIRALAAVYADHPDYDQTWTL